MTPQQRSEISSRTRDEARRAIYAAAVEIIDESKGYEVATRAAILRDVALSVRFAAGGPQPGSSAA